MNDILSPSMPSTDPGADELARIAREFRHHEQIHATNGDRMSAERAAEEALKIERRLDAVRGGDWRGH